MSDEPTILIVGAGTFGTSLAHHLGLSYKDASKVTIIDRAPSPPKSAAAIDVNRIIRTDYASPMYCDLAYEALHSWFWTAEIGNKFHQTGWVMMDDSEGGNLSKKIRQVFHDRGSHHSEEIPLDQLQERWPALKGTDTKGFQNAYFNPDAGWVNAAAATGSFMKATEDRGVKRLTGDVAELVYDESAGKITGIRTAEGQAYTAEKIVLCTGAWTSSLLSPVEDVLDIPDEHRIERQIQAAGVVSAYYKIGDDDIETLSKMPPIFFGQLGEVIPPSEENRTLKYASNKSFTNTAKTKSGQTISVPAAGSQYDVPERLKQETEELIMSRLLPEFAKGKKPDYWRICWDARSPSEDPILDKHPTLQNLYLAVGGSFQSYKFMPNIGKYMIRVLNGQSNGEEKDAAWAWKKGTSQQKSDPKLGAFAPTRELRDLEGNNGSSKL